jgi:hypothetical protein
LGKYQVLIMQKLVVIHIKQGEQAAKDWFNKDVEG